MRGIIVFVKNPELGKVKTRLAKTMGDEKALEIYNKLIGYTREVLLKVNDTKKYIFYSSFIDDEDEWSRDDFEKKLQISGDLGSKMTTAIQDVFEICDQVVIIGSDCPQLTPAHIESAFRELDTHNVVVGPSMDGGYYLLGMDQYYPALFQDIQWSTETVCSDTLAIAAANGLSSARLEELSDIDYEEDWVEHGF